MSQRISEKLVEPARIETGSVFKIKIKARRYTTYEELLDVTYNELKLKKYKNLKGDINYDCEKSRII